MLELVHVFPLVQQDFTIAVVDDGFFHNLGRNDVIHLLRNYHGLTEILSDCLKKILNIFTHIGRHKSLPTLFD